MRRDVQALEAGTFDVLVIGGGMHGAWIALRAIEAGFSVALIERDDFAGATSANSLKILHGGLRYLQHLDYPRMRSSIAARREFALRSPHLFEPLGCVLPLRRGGLKRPVALRVALALNDLVSAGRNDGVDAGAMLPRGRLLPAQACREFLSPLTTSSAVGGALWWDGLARDTARLVLEPLLEAARGGAVIANRISAERYLIAAGRIEGVEARDAVGARRFPIRAKVVVNAAGPWVEALSSKSGLSGQSLPPAWMGGMNLVLKRPLGIDKAAALTSSSNGVSRELFFVPWRGVTMVGTHYEPLDSLEEVRGPAPRAIIERFLEDVARAAPRAGVTMDDVAVVHWGALPLAAAGQPLPAREPTILGGQTAAGAKGLVLLAAEKLTSAPLVSLRVLERIVAEGGVPAGSPAPMTIRISPPGFDSFLGLPPAALARLSARYGVHWQAVAQHAADDAALLEPITAGCEVLGVEIVHAIREEMAGSLEDLVLRRLGLGDAGDPGTPVLEACMAIAAREWNTSPDAQRASIHALTSAFLANRQGIASTGR